MMTPKPCRKNTPALKLSYFAFSYLPIMLNAIIGTEALATYFLAVPPIKIVVCVYVYIYAKLNNKRVRPFLDLFAPQDQTPHADVPSRFKR